MKYIDYLAHEQSNHSCGLCGPTDDTVIISDDSCYATPALAPYGERHVLICPWRHVESYTDLTLTEKTSLHTLCETVMSRMYATGASEVVMLLRDSKCFSDGEHQSSTSGKTRKHCHAHIVADVQIMPKMTQTQSNERIILTDQEMRERTVSLQS